MANIDYRKFVDVNIKHSSSHKINSTRDTTVCFVATASIDEIVDNYNDFAELFEGAAETTAKAYAYIYFANGGQKLHVLSCTASAADIKDAILELPDEEIVVAYPGQTAYLVSAISTLNATETFYGIKLKLAVVRTTSAITVNPTAHVLAKYSSKSETQATIAAYLSRININKANSVQDYDYTLEVLEDAGGHALYEDSDDELLTNILEADENVDMKLAGQVRNLGGNAKDGSDLVNEYVLIVLQQTLTEKVLNVLTDKIKGEPGVAAIHTAIAEEMVRYVNCGYLATDKVYTDETITYTYNGVDYTVIEKNTAMLLGYQLLIVPYSALTAEDKAAHKAPPIYIVVADSYGIRSVSISGITY